MLLDVNTVNKLRKDPNCWMDYDFAKWLNCEIEKNIMDRLEKKKNKRNIFLFNLFPMRSIKFEKSIYLQFETDIWDISIESIREKYPWLIEDKNVILLTYNIENNFLIRDLISRDVYHKNEYIEFGVKDDVFPIRVTNMGVEK